MAGTMEPHPGQRFETLIRWLGLKDPQKNDMAVTMFCRLGKPVVHSLIQEAFKRGKRSPHRVAILDLVERIGGPFQHDDIFSLRLLLRHRDPGVRAKAERVLISMRPGPLPDTPEDLAAERAFNPYLQSLPDLRRRQPQGTRPTSRTAIVRSELAALVRYARAKAARQKRENKEQGKKRR